MYGALFLKSLVLGFAIAAPLGPIGALCIARTLDRGFLAGVAGGLGTALADALYASLAALGFAAFSVALAAVDVPLRLLGGGFMLWLGWKSMTPAPVRDAAPVAARDILGTTLTTFALTMANPLTILSFGVIFAGLGLAGNSDPVSAVLLVLGVFCGSMLWWVLLSGGVAMARSRLPAGFALWVSRLSGALLVGFGLWAFASLL